MDPQLQELFDQLGAQAPALQAILQVVIQPLQDQVLQLQQQLGQAQMQNPIPDPVPAPIPDPVPDPAPPVPMPALAPAPREPKVADPPLFTGDRNQTESFICSVRTCFQLMPSRFPPGDEARKILFALGFIQGGTAGTWANNHANKMLDPTTPNPFTTFQEFQSTFEHAFGAADHAQKAQTDMAVEDPCTVRDKLVQQELK